MKIDVNEVINKLLNRIAELQLQVVALEVEKEMLQKEQKANDK